MSTILFIKVFLYLQLVGQGVKVTRMKSKWLILFMVFSLFLVACGGSDEAAVEEVVVRAGPHRQPAHAVCTTLASAGHTHPAWYRGHGAHLGHGH